MWNVPVAWQTSTRNPLDISAAQFKLGNCELKNALIILVVTDESSTTILGNENDLKVLTSPDYPSNYPHNTYITFTVYSPEGSNVKVDILDLYIEYYCDDPIYIYDGK